MTHPSFYCRLHDRPGRPAIAVLLQAQTSPASPAAGGPVIHPTKEQNPQQQMARKQQVATCGRAFSACLAARGSVVQ